MRPFLLGKNRGERKTPTEWILGLGQADRKKGEKKGKESLGG